VSFYLHAFCLDETKAIEGHEEILSGPYDGVAITWEYLRGFKDDETTDHEFVYAENTGFWYPVALVEYNPPGYSKHASRSMRPDAGLGRFSDVVVTAELPRGVTPIPCVSRVIPYADLADFEGIWEGEIETVLAGVGDE